ncbi:MAG: mechanosensitive ion channel domain-containing protein [Cyanobacteria bacterium P01_B01_bin.77]
MAQNILQLTPLIPRGLKSARQLLIGIGSTTLEYLTFPILCWLTLRGTAELLTTFARNPANLIETFCLPLVTLFFIYKLIALLINLFVGKDIYVVLVNRFLLPLFLTYIVIQILGLFTDLVLLGDTQLFTVAQTTITLRSLFIASLGLYFWFAGVNGLAQCIRQVLLDRLRIDEGTLDATLILFRYFLIGLGLFLVFNELNLDSNAIAAISGGLAVGLGFGLKDIVVNFISGIVLLFERSIHPGDIIEVDNLLGRVAEINLRATTIKTNNEIEVVIPNQLFMMGSLKSYTRRSRRARFHFPISISCEYDPEFVIEILLDAVRQDTNVLRSLTTTVTVAELGQSIIYNMRVWTNEHLDISTIRSNLYRQIMPALARHGIEPAAPGEIAISKELTVPQTQSPVQIALKMDQTAKAFVLHQSVGEADGVAATANTSDTTQANGSREPSQIELVEASFEKIKPYANEFVASFYQYLFQKNPKLRSLFRRTDMKKMYKKLLDTLVLLVENLRNPTALRPVLKELGAAHKSYGVIAQYYPAVCSALIATFPKYIPNDWTPDVQRAWSDTFQAVTQIMLEGADEMD